MQGSLLPKILARALVLITEVIFFWHLSNLGNLSRQANLKQWESWFSQQKIYFGKWHIRMKDDIQLDTSARHMIILLIEDVLSGDQLSFFGFFICLLSTEYTSIITTQTK